MRNNGGLLFVDDTSTGYTIADSIPVYVFDTVGKSVITLTAADITDTYSVSGNSDYIVYTQLNGAVTAVYILNSSL